MLKNYVAVVLDRSGSMSHLRSDVIKVCNGIFDNIRKNSHNQKTLISFYTFANNVRTEFFNADVRTLEDLNYNSYRPDGMTALFDGVKKAIDDLSSVNDANNENTSFLVIVITDGCENASSVRDRVVKELLVKTQKTDRWTFAFNLPPGHKESFLRNFDVPNDNVREWEGTAKGLEETSVAIFGGIDSYFGARTRGFTSVKSFYATTDLSSLQKKDVSRNLEDLSNDFHVFTVDKECAIKEFVEKKTNRPYVLGEAYYQLTKKETIQANKDMLVMEKNKRRIWGGEDARELLGLDIHGNIKVTPGNHANWDILVQSTSVNRKLVRGTKVLVKK